MLCVTFVFDVHLSSEFGAKMVSLVAACMGKLAAKFEDKKCLCHLMNRMSVLVEFVCDYLRLKAFHLNLAVKALKLVFLQDILELD